MLQLKLFKQRDAQSLGCLDLDNSLTTMIAFLKDTPDTHVVGYLYSISDLVATMLPVRFVGFFLAWRLIFLLEWQHRVYGLGKSRKLECSCSALGQNCCKSKSVQQAKGGCSACLCSNLKLLGYWSFASATAQFT